MVQRLLDWSGERARRGRLVEAPDAREWLNYAALDVEVLIELRHAIADVLAEQNKTSLGRRGIRAHLRCVEAAPTRRDRWRRTSGIHKVRDRQRLAAVRELWTVRDHIARSRDIAPGRILPDSAIIRRGHRGSGKRSTISSPTIFSGQKQKRSAHVWLAAPENPRELTPIHRPDGWITDRRPRSTGARKPEAAARLDAARAALTELSATVSADRESVFARAGTPIVLGLAGFRRHRLGRRNIPCATAGRASGSAN